MVRFPFCLTTHHAMLPAVIVLLLLTALVATDSAPRGGDER